jgi:hypothetical protein
VEQMLSGKTWHLRLPDRTAGDDQRTADQRAV